MPGMGKYMIDVILIDDEEPALLEMEYLLNSYNKFNIIGKFTNPVVAIKRIRELKPQVVFLDIDMPQLSGLSMSKELFGSGGEPGIVFVTAHDRYAVQAFEVQALDYLLKPVAKSRLDQTVNKIFSIKHAQASIKQKKLEIKTMGHFQIGWAGEVPIKWRTEKNRELMAFLLHNEGTAISKDRIIDQIWCDYELNKASHQLHNSIYYIRKTLEEYGISQEQIHINRGYCLLLGDVYYDRKIIELRLREFNGRKPSVDELEDLLGLLKGDYLQFEDWAWAVYDREIFSKQETDLLLMLAESYMAAREYKKAEAALKRGFLRNPFEENITVLILELCRKNGEKAKAARHYAEYCKYLKEELTILPTEKIKKLYNLIINE
ncbi:MAG: hypothetical protein K0R50_3963 [Eubacterium sp.]|jgi:two-component SAPR family response regulator|nr:hypothetical protein [Eubacterium sp.]